MAEVRSIFRRRTLTGRSRGHIVELSDPPCSLHHAVVRAIPALAAQRLSGRASTSCPSLRSVISTGSWPSGMASIAANASCVLPMAALLDARALDDDASGRGHPALVGTARCQSPSLGHGHGCDRCRTPCRPATARSWCTEEYAPGGVFARLDGWLAANAAKHGFFRPYTTWRGGVQPEPWHLSYAPVAEVARWRQFSIGSVAGGTGCRARRSARRGGPGVAGDHRALRAQHRRRPPGAGGYFCDQARLK